MARKKKPEEHVNHERWLVSYADFITLLFAFFVVMYAVSEIDKAKMKKLAKAVTFAFGRKGTDLSMNFTIFEGIGGNPLSNTKAPRTDGLLQKFGEDAKEAERLEQAIQKQYEQKLERPGSAVDIIEVENTEAGILIRLSNLDFFDPGGAHLRPEAMPVLDSLGSQLNLRHRDLEVQGHTDSRLLGANKKFADNWSLAAMRAVSVVRYLEVAPQIPSDHLLVSTYGQHRPIGDNLTNRGRAQNRRIDILLRHRNSTQLYPTKPSHSKRRGSSGT